MMISDFEICPLKPEIKENIWVGYIPPACQPYPMVSHVPCRGGRYPSSFRFHVWGWVPTLLDISTPLNMPAKGPGTRDTHPLERTWDQRYPPTPCGQTDTCENITATAFTSGKNCNVVRTLIWIRPMTDDKANMLSNWLNINSNVY